MIWLVLLLAWAAVVADGVLISRRRRNPPSAEYIAHLEDICHIGKDPVNDPDPLLYPATRKAHDG